MINLNKLVKESCELVKQKGFNVHQPFGEFIALVHSELSEALEEYRAGNPEQYYLKETVSRDGEVKFVISTDWSDGVYKGEKPEGTTIELADVILRILCYCGANNIDIEKAILRKHEYNKSRPYKHGGKKI
jgi:NTP pyrophosphatase (non-canonical NTP hydrolase)